MNREPRVGILALQGDVAAHAEILRALGVAVLPIRHVAQLEALGGRGAGLVLPGGESTALLRLMEGEPWFEAIAAFHHRGGAIFATCAGAILVAKKITGTSPVIPDQPSMGLLDIDVARNAWGRQIASFTTSLDVPGLERPLRVAFIRAPRITRVGPDVEVLARHDAEPVLVRQSNILAATFHPEIEGDVSLHAMFLEAGLGEPSALAGKVRES
jgi:5'-phosphate synthase pdxT subunit